MSVSFHNSSAERDCQASLQLQRSIRTCHPAITIERWGPGIRIPLAPSAPAIPPSSPVSQPAPCSGTQRDNKTVSANQKQLLSPSNCCHSLRLPPGYAAVLKSHWLTLLFLFCPFTFSSPIEIFLLPSILLLWQIWTFLRIYKKTEIYRDKEKFRICCLLPRQQQIAVSCTLILGYVVTDNIPLIMKTYEYLRLSSCEIIMALG